MAARIASDLRKAGTGDGRLSRLESALAKMGAFIDNLVGGEGISIKPNANGGATVRSIATPGGTASSAAWSGVVWYLGAVLWDFRRVDAAPGDALYSAATPPLNWVDVEVVGIYLKVKLSDGSTEFVDAITSPSDVDRYSYFYVATKNPDDSYTLSNRTCGDIRIDLVPWLPEAEA